MATVRAWSDKEKRYVLEERPDIPAFSPENVRAWMLATPFTPCEAWREYVDHMIDKLTKPTAT